MIERKRDLRSWRCENCVSFSYRSYLSQTNCSISIKHTTQFANSKTNCQISNLSSFLFTSGKFFFSGNSCLLGKRRRRRRAFSFSVALVLVLSFGLYLFETNQILFVVLKVLSDWNKRLLLLSFGFV